MSRLQTVTRPRIAGQNHLDAHQDIALSPDVLLEKTTVVRDFAEGGFFVSFGNPVIFTPVLPSLSSVSKRSPRPKNDNVLATRGQFSCSIVRLPLRSESTVQPLPMDFRS